MTGTGSSSGSFGNSGLNDILIPGGQFDQLKLDLTRTHSAGSPNTPHGLQRMSIPGSVMAGSLAGANVIPGPGPTSLDLPGSSGTDNGRGTVSSAMHVDHAQSFSGTLSGSQAQVQAIHTDSSSSNSGSPLTPAEAIDGHASGGNMAVGSSAGEAVTHLPNVLDFCGTGGQAFDSSNYNPRASRSNYGGGSGSCDGAMNNPNTWQYPNRSNHHAQGGQNWGPYNHSSYNHSIYQHAMLPMNTTQHSEGHQYPLPNASSDDQYSLSQQGSWGGERRGPSKDGRTVEQDASLLFEFFKSCQSKYARLLLRLQPRALALCLTQSLLAISPPGRERRSQCQRRPTGPGTQNEPSVMPISTERWPRANPSAR